jgi:hypothetical protein
MDLDIPLNAIKPIRFPSICSFSLQSDAGGERIRPKKQVSSEKKMFFHKQRRGLIVEDYRSIKMNDFYSGSQRPLHVVATSPLLLYLPL